MRHADQPELTERIHVAATAEQVWAIVGDIALPVGPSPELQAVEWAPGCGPTPAVGQRFVGTNRNVHLGEWQMTCTVTEWEPPHRFAWVAGEVDEPITTWRFTVETEPGGGCMVSQWVRLGIGRSGLSAAIERFPDKEERIVERRLGDFRAGMRANLDAIRAAVETAG